MEILTSSFKLFQTRIEKEKLFFPIEHKRRNFEECTEKVKAQSMKKIVDL